MNVALTLSHVACVVKPLRDVFHTNDARTLQFLPSAADAAYTRAAFWPFVHSDAVIFFICSRTDVIPSRASPSLLYFIRHQSKRSAYGKVIQLINI